MQIRIKRDTQLDIVHYFRGQLLEVPTVVAKQLIADGNAVEVKKAERAVLPNRGR